MKAKALCAALCLIALAGCSSTDRGTQKASEIGYYSVMAGLRSLIGGSCRGCDAGMDAADRSIGRDLSTPPSRPPAP